MSTFSIYLKECIPPIFMRIADKIRRTMKMARTSRLHPFDCVPNSLKPKWIVDVGANVGDVAIAALESYPDSRVICFEPVRAQFNTLKQRMEKYGDRVVLFNMAISDITGEGEINLTTFHRANSVVPISETYHHLNPSINAVGKEKIDLVRLDDISVQFPTRYVDILKIDVEGHELSALKGGANFIAHHVDTVIIEVSLQRDTGWEKQQVFEVFALLKEMGFRLVNVLDIYNFNAETQPEDTDLMLSQMDCVFRHVSKLRSRG